MPLDVISYALAKRAYLKPVPKFGFTIDELLDILYNELSDESDKTVSADETLGVDIDLNIGIFRDVVVDAGYTLSLEGKTYVMICRNLTVNGTIDKLARGGAGGSAPSGGGAGGRGGGCLIIIVADTLKCTGTIRANGAAGSNAGTTGASENASPGEKGFAWVISGYDVGLGGDGGYRPDYDCQGKGYHGGGGGAGGWAYYGGDGGDVIRTTFAYPANLAKALLRAVFGGLSMPILYSGGGGGGGTHDGNGCGGGGGGGGGLLYIICNKLDNTGTIEANGGAGGAGGGEGAYDNGGGGGGGGLVYVFYKSLINSGTLQALGGAGGTGDNNGSDGANGSATAFQI